MKSSSLVRSFAVVVLLVAAFGAGWLQGQGDAGPTARPQAGKPTAPKSPQTDDARAAADADTLQALEALGYVDAVEAAPEQSGVTLHQPEAEAGWNLVLSAHTPEAVIMTMAGEVVHRWHLPFETAFPDSRGGEGDNYWRQVHLFGDGGILAIHEGLGLVRLDRDSKLLWTLEEAVHHDLDVRADGSILVLSRVAHVVPKVNPDAPLLEDFVVELSPEGAVLSRHSILDAVLDSPWKSTMRMTRDYGDLLHTNTLEILDDTLTQRIPAFAPGRVLLTIPYLDALAVMDLSTDTIVWMTVGGWLFPHKGTVLDNGHLMVFDNRSHGKHSAVVELDPAELAVDWSYVGDDTNGFYSYECGSAQRLPGGNTLITETDAGRSFEVTPDGTVVWDYTNPHRVDVRGEDKVARLMEVIRVPTQAWPPAKLGQ